jgi:hypothetical protein
MGSVNHDWRRQVVGFNYERQRQFWRDFKLDRLEHWEHAAMLGAVVMVWMGLMLGWFGWRRRRQDRATARWQSLCSRLARAGLRGCRTRAAHLCRASGSAMAAM